jgi:hypothetical protein
MDFKERKARLLKSMDEMVASIQRDKKCVQAAKNEEELRSCRQGRRERPGGRGGDREPRRGPMRGPGGPGQASPPAPDQQAK